MTVDRGWIDDEIVISLTNENVTRRCIDYSVKCSVFNQPSAFTVHLGEQESALEMLAKHKPGHPFEIRIQRVVPGSGGTYDLDVPLQTGRLDAVELADTDATTVEMRGRDNMAALSKSFFMQEEAFTEATFYDITAKQLKAVGFDPDLWLTTGEDGRKKAITNAGGGMKRSAAQVAEPTVSTDAELQKLFSWTPAQEIAERAPEEAAALRAMGIELQSKRFGTWVPSTMSSAPSASSSSVDGQTVMVEDVTGGQPKTELKTLKAMVGQQRYEWLKAQYKRVGLFLWCAPDGKFILSAPNTSQEPAFRLQRLIAGTPAETNILSGGFRNDTVSRYSHTLVYGRAGGGKDGRKQIVGQYVDQEMVDLGWICQISSEDRDIKTQKAADYLARRYASEARRSSRSLNYTLPGHSAPSLIHPGQRFPFYVGCVVHVKDEKCGLDGNYYLGEVEFSRNPQSTSRLTLYHMDDLVFAEEAA
jgi:hypothetical protein